MDQACKRAEIQKNVQIEPNKWNWAASHPFDTVRLPYIRTSIIMDVIIYIKIG